MSILHNFKLTTFPTPFYISKKGNDSNSGLSPDLPRATFSQISGRTHGVVGTGVYKGAFTITASNPCSWFADSDVIINATGSLVTSINNLNLNIGDLNIGGRFTLLMNNNTINIGANSAGSIRFRNTVIRDTTFNKSNVNASLTVQFSFSVLDNIKNNSWTNTRFTSNNSSIFNSVLDGINNTSEFTSCYVDENTVIRMNSYFSSPSSRFIANNFRGKFIVNNVEYEIKRNKKGDLIPERIGNGILDLDILHGGTGTLYSTLRCFAEDAQFLNLNKRDYWSVLPSSPNVYYAAMSSSNIGAVTTSLSLKATDTPFSSGTIVNLPLLVNDFVVGNASTTGSVITQAIQVAPIVQQLFTINIHNVLTYDSSQTKGSIENNNVTISNDFADGSAGANPKRLTYEMQWSTNETIPTISSEWNNGGLTAPNTWVKMEHNIVPQIDVAGLGNGEPTFNTATAMNVRAKFVRFRITIYKGI
jgi:hypothetical protein